MDRGIPINLIRAFEVASRTGSFKSAAAELNLTPSAISHSVRKLEDFIGTSLFERTGREVALNQDGEELMRHIGQAFDQIRQGVEIVSTRAPGLLRLHCAPSFATQWLTPRLPRLFTKHPGIDIRLAAGYDYGRFEMEDFDADIVYGQVRQPGLDIIPLKEETVTPLCAPEIARKIRSPEDLFDQVRIESSRNLVRWSEWFATNDLQAPQPNGSRFDRSFLAIAFAADGLGVALESTLLAEREIETGRLVAPLLDTARNVTLVGHRLVYPPSVRQRRVLRIFSSWLIRELGLEDGPDSN